MHTSKQDNRPSMQFYPDKWHGDKGLRMCSLAARGLWIDILCIMWESPERGTLREANGKQIEAKGLAKLVGETEATTQQLLDELFSHGVYSTLDDGTIYNRYMRAKWKLSRSRAEAGRKGGKANKTEAKMAAPSSSPSSSPSPVQQEEEEKTPPPCEAAATQPVAPEPEKPDPTADRFRKLCIVWNGLPEEYVIQVASIEPARNTKRYRSFGERLKAKGWEEDAGKALKMIERGECGFFAENDRGWKPDIEFFLRPESVQKILEGKYAQGKKAAGAQPASFRDRALMEANAAAERRKAWDAALLRKREEERHAAAGKTRTD